MIAQGADRDGRFLLWAGEGTRGTLVVRAPSPVHEKGEPDPTYSATLENIAAGTKNLVVRLPKLP